MDFFWIRQYPYKSQLFCVIMIYYVIIPTHNPLIIPEDFPLKESLPFLHTRVQ